MTQTRPMQLTSITKETRIRQLQEQIQILEMQLENAKKDLKKLQRS